ncbi:MAG TPA: PilZ domain-containing protein [Burkholderiales bacterium]|nr:PilZ domain-containing protein [Burkholderiales bacterium]
MKTEAVPYRGQRKEERIVTSVPVDLGGSSGITRDVSASGIFFETDAAFAPGSTVRFKVELDTPSGKMKLRCCGSIVRVEHRNGKVGVAVHITESVMEASK